MRAAVIPTMGRDDLMDCWKAITPQVDHVVLITHNFDYTEETFNLHVIPYNKDVPNISEMWNLGLDLATYLGADHIAVLNDDAVVPPDWFDKIENAMIARGCLAGWSSGTHDGDLVYTKAEPTLIRMSGFAFVVDKGVRADEQFQWWYGDNDIEWKCREWGGVVHVGGEVEHRHPNETTVGVLRKIANEDAQRFFNKWGRLP